MVIICVYVIIMPRRYPVTLAPDIIVVIVVIVIVTTFRTFDNARGDYARIAHCHAAGYIVGGKVKRKDVWQFDKTKHKVDKNLRPTSHSTVRRSYRAHDDRRHNSSRNAGKPITAQCNSRQVETLNVTAGLQEQTCKVKAALLRSLVARKVELGHRDTCGAISTRDLLQTILEPRTA